MLLATGVVLFGQVNVQAQLEGNVHQLDILAARVGQRDGDQVGDVAEDRALDPVHGGEVVHVEKDVLHLWQEPTHAQTKEKLQE